MTKEEAKKVLRIMSFADGGGFEFGCPTCAKELFTMFMDKFPEHAELAKNMMQEGRSA